MKDRFNRNLFLVLALIVGAPSFVYAGTEDETYKPGLLLHFVPIPANEYSKSNEEPIGSLIDTGVSFNAADYQKSKNLTKYNNMNHGLLWQGFFNARKPGKYTFVVSGGNVPKSYMWGGNGGSRSTHCQFDATLAGVKLFSLTGSMLKSFGHKTLELDSGVHKLEAWFACSSYRKSWKENFVNIEVKRPGELEVSELKESELLHRK